jgi:hypothetical protein
VDIFAKKKTQVRFAHNWNFSPIFGQILTSSKDSLTSATVVANMALASSWDLFQSKGDKNWLGETPGSKTKSNLSSPYQWYQKKNTTQFQKTPSPVPP